MTFVAIGTLRVKTIFGLLFEWPLRTGFYCSLMLIALLNLGLNCFQKLSADVIGKQRAKPDQTVITKLDKSRRSPWCMAYIVCLRKKTKHNTNSRAPILKNLLVMTALPFYQAHDLKQHTCSIDVNVMSNRHQYDVV